MCVVLNRLKSDSHLDFRFWMRTHTIVSSYTSPSAPRWSHAMFWLPPPGHHDNLVYRHPGNSSNTALQNKKEKISFSTNKPSYRHHKEGEKWVVLKCAYKLAFKPQNFKNNFFYGNLHILLSRSNVQRPI